MNNKDRYIELCNLEPTIPIFSQYWWMDAVCGGNNWDVILIEKCGHIVASLPYYFIKRKDGLIIRQPILTQTNGVWIKYPLNLKYSKKLSFEKEIISEIIGKLEQQQIISYNQNFKYNFTNWLPFYWAGFEQTTRYSYIINDLTNLESVFSNFDYSKRKNIKKAEKIVNIKYDLSCQAFYNNHKMTLAKQNSKIGYSFELFTNIYNAAYNKDQGKTFYAVDVNNNIHAALFIIWDENSAYDLISTIDPDFRESGAASLVVREAIQYVSSKTNVFDFEGSMIENVENSFRQFGTIQMPYFNIKKEYNKKPINILLENIYVNSTFLQNIYKNFKDFKRLKTR